MTGMGSQDSMSLDDLDSIMNLQRQEAFDDGGQNGQRKERRRLHQSESFDSGKKEPKLSKSKSMSSEYSVDESGQGEHD